MPQLAVAYTTSNESVYTNPLSVLIIVVIKVIVFCALLGFVNSEPTTVLGQHVWPVRSKGLIIFVGGVVVFHSIYRFLIEKRVIDTPLERRVISWMNGWQLSHVVLYFVLGFIFPQLWFMFFLMGIVWEAIEELLGHITRDREWWKASAVDIPLNTSGLLLGVLSRATISPQMHKTSFGGLVNATPSAFTSRSTSLAISIVAISSLPILFFFNEDEKLC